MRLIAEEEVALEGGVNGAGEVALVHLAALESILGVVILGGGGGETLGFSGHVDGAGRREMNEGRGFR